jgi:hypothetical protein
MMLGLILGGFSFAGIYIPVVPDVIDAMNKNLKEFKSEETTNR